KKQYNQLYQYLSTLQFDKNATKQQKSQIQKEAKNYFIENNKIYQRNKEKPQRVIKNDQKTSHSIYVI
ncbi:17170_t:CDS:1, partial [Gigaspora margarita]